MDFSQTIFNFLFGAPEGQTVKQLKKIVATLMENQNLQQSVHEAHTKALNITTIHLANNRHMINIYVDHRINELCNGLQKLEADVATIYNYTNTLRSKIVTPMLVSPIDLKTILTNIQAVFPSCLSLPNDPNTNIWYFYEFLETHPLI